MAYNNRGWGWNRGRGRNRRRGCGRFVLLFLFTLFGRRLRRLGNNFDHPAQHPGLKHTQTLLLLENVKSSANTGSSICPELKANFCVFFFFFITKLHVVVFFFTRNCSILISFDFPHNILALHYSHTRVHIIYGLFFKWKYHPSLYE